MDSWNLSPKQWIIWATSTFVAGCSMAAFAFTTFSTIKITDTLQKEHSNFITIREKDDFIKRLDRIEDKQDAIITHQGVPYRPKEIENER